MPERRVSFEQGGYYHIYNRGAGRQDIFCEPENYHFLLRRFKKIGKAINVTILAYCLIPNHYHLLVRQDGEVVAGLLPQKSFNSYTKAFNRRYQRTGTLFEGRYKAVRVDDDSHLVHLCRYIHANPVVAGLVATPEAWPYSNYREWISTRPGTLVDLDFVREHFGDSNQYKRFVEAYLQGSRILPPAVQKLLKVLEW